MQITKEEKGDLVAILKVKVEPNDYSEKVNKAIKDYRKKVSMPGFRPGMVPPGLIRKMYGKSILVEEVNQVVSQSLNDYITTEKLQILGNPMLENEQEDLEWVEGKEYEFSFELGLSPDVKVEIGAGDKIKHYKVTADDDLVGKELAELRKRYGQVKPADNIAEEDFVYGTFTQLDDAGQPVEGGISNSASVMIHKIPDDATKKALLGKSKDDVIKVDPKKMVPQESEVAHMLGVDAQYVDGLPTTFSFTVSGISRVEEAAMDQAFFDKLFGEGEVKDEAGCKLKIKEHLEQSLVHDSENKLRNDIVEHLLSKVKVPLPDDFLKRWMIQASKDENAEEDIAKNYDKYAKGLKWQLIENKIIRDNSLKVEHDEALAFSKASLQQQLAQYGQTGISDEDLEKYAHQLMHKEEEGKKIYDQLYEQKVFATLREKVTLVEKEVDFTEFVNLVQNKKEEKNSFFNFGFKRNKK
ncbi:MAG: trigger factor [Flavobacteriales bacterium]|nr:trigger factor [Flavobacteriales bacterium]